MAKITFEQFKGKVYDSYKESLRNQDRQEVEEYFRSQEVQEEMSLQYKNLMSRMEKGEIEESVILTGGAGGCAQCLVLMF